MWIEGTVGLEFENNGPTPPVVEHEIHVHVLLSRRLGNRGAGGAGSFTPRRKVKKSKSKKEREKVRSKSKSKA